MKKLILMIVVLTTMSFGGVEEPTFENNESPQGCTSPFNSSEYTYPSEGGWYYCNGGNCVGISAMQNAFLCSVWEL